MSHGTQGSLRESDRATEYSSGIVDVDIQAYATAQPTVLRLFGLLGQSCEVSFFIYICFGSRVPMQGLVA